MASITVKERVDLVNHTLFPCAIPSVGFDFPGIYAHSMDLRQRYALEIISNSGHSVSILRISRIGIVG